MTKKGDKLICLNCGYGKTGHAWEQKKDTPPVSCPNCKSYRWQTHKLLR